MKVINSKLAAIGLAAFVFASCSDSSSDNGGGKDSPNIVDGTTIEIGNVASSTVANYKNSTAKARMLLGSRAEDETSTVDLTKMPSTPSDAEVEAAHNLGPAQTTIAEGTWKFGSFKELTVKSIQNAKIYVQGAKTLNYEESKGGNKIYVLQGGKLNFTGAAGSAAVAKKDTIIVLAAEGFTSANDFSIDGTLYAAAPIGKLNDAKTEAIQNITINGNVYTDSRYEASNSKGEKTTVIPVLRAKTLTVNAGAQVNVKEKVSKTSDVVINGALHVDKTIEVNNVTINNGGSLSSDGSVKASEALVMNAGATLTTNYLNVTGNEYTKEGKEIIAVKPGNATATLNGACKINIGANGVINTNNLITDNTADQIVLGGEGSVAVVKADKFTSKTSGIVNAFSTPENNQVYLIQFSASNIGGADVSSFDDVDLAASYLDYDKATDGKALVAAENHTWKYDGQAITEKKKLDLIANITSSDDNQSASCITPANNKLYVTYHTQGENFGGKIEIASVSGNKISIDKTIAPTNTKGLSYDFNHVMKDGNTLYVCGGSNVGAILGTFTLNSGDINESEGMTEFNIDNKTAHNGYDANCVALFKNNVIVSGTRGYEIFEPNLGYAHSYVATPGKAKHLAISGSNLIGLNYLADTEEGNAEVNGEIQTFTNADLTTSTKFNVGAIAPNNGKNTIAVDNEGNIYVCKSAKGLQVYNAQGTPGWSWIAPLDTKGENKSVDNRQGYVNGVAVSGNYVYVAAGAYGVVVLNKADGSEVAHRAVGNLNSANYISVDNEGNIYVAYGKGRIRVFKLVGTK